MTFIGKLTCAYFVPGDSVATDDASGFCDPSLDQQITRAAAEQTSNPAAAAGQWARLDRQLTDLAIWIPTVTPNDDRLLVQPRSQLPVQPGLGSTYRPILDPLVPVADQSPVGLGSRSEGEHSTHQGPPGDGADDAVQVRSRGRKAHIAG